MSIMVTYEFEATPRDFVCVTENSSSESMQVIIP